jgi:hypothetical protein
MNPRSGQGLAEPEIPSLPWFGTTWYTGGPSYWLRRALASLLLLACVGVYVAILAAIFVPILADARNRPAGLTVLALVLLATLVGFVWMWRRGDRKPTSGEVRRDARALMIEVTGLRIVKLGFVALGLLALVLLILGGGRAARLLVGLMAVIVGLTFSVLFLVSFGPLLFLSLRALAAEPLPVRRARQEIDTWYREHGLENRRRGRQ